MVNEVMIQRRDIWTVSLRFETARTSVDLVLCTSAPWQKGRAQNTMDECRRAAFSLLSPVVAFCHFPANKDAISPQRELKTLTLRRQSHRHPLSAAHYPRRPQRELAAKDIALSR
jgi:hypothetical protein